MRETSKKKTLKDINKELVNAAKAVREAIKSDLGWKTDQPFYDAINGTKELSPAEKKTFCKHFGITEDAIDWADKKNFVA